jgi:hypothetical protein
MKSQCPICGSKFASRQCYFCQRKVCSSCVVPEDVTGSQSTTKCISCDRKKINKISILSVLKRNKFIFGNIRRFLDLYSIPTSISSNVWHQNRSDFFAAHFYNNCCHNHSVPVYVNRLAETLSYKQPNFIK